MYQNMQNDGNKIAQIMKELESEGSDAEVVIERECYVTIRHDKDGYNIDLTPYWGIEDSQDMKADQVREYLKTLGIE